MCRPFIFDMPDTIAHYFKPINHTFLDKGWQEGFEVFYRVGSGEQAKFLKFAEYTPTEYSRLSQIMQEKDNQEFFIHETDLVRYYQERVLKNLQWELSNDPGTSREVFQAVYSVASRIICDYLEIHTSERLLRLLDGMPDYLLDTLERESLTFPQIFGITNKEGKTHFHCMNVGFYCLSMGWTIRLPREELREVCLGGMLSDIGKKFIPVEVLYKEGNLSQDDIKYVRKHPSYGRKILNDMKCYSDIVLRMVGEHHENFDGTGYPFGYAAEKISLHGRICKIMDVFAAMTSKRTYSERLNPVQTMSIMKNDMMGQFDQKLLQTFFNSIAAS